MDPTIRYLFNSKGFWIASLVEGNVFSIDGDWLGWVRDVDQAVISPTEQYVGSIVHENRLYYHLDYHLGMALVKKPGTGPLHGNAGYPGQASCEELPAGFRDVEV